MTVSKAHLELLNVFDLNMQLKYPWALQLLMTLLCLLCQATEVAQVDRTMVFPKAPVQGKRTIGSVLICPKGYKVYAGRCRQPAPLVDLFNLEPGGSEYSASENIFIVFEVILKELNVFDLGNMLLKCSSWFPWPLPLLLTLLCLLCQAQKPTGDRSVYPSAGKLSPKAPITAPAQIPKKEGTVNLPHQPKVESKPDKSSQETIKVDLNPSSVATKVNKVVAKSPVQENGKVDSQQRPKRQLILITFPQCTEGVKRVNDRCRQKA